MATHRIRRQILELDLPRVEGAVVMQRRASRLFREKVLPALEEQWDAWAGPDQILQFERIEIDLGQLPEARWETEFVERSIKAMLAGALDGHLSTAPDPTIPTQRIPVQQRMVALFLEFLSTGALPWYGAGLSLRDLEAQLAGSHALTGPALRHLLFDRPEILYRLFYQFQPYFIHHLLDETLALPAGWSAALEPALKNLAQGLAVAKANRPIPAAQKEAPDFVAQPVESMEAALLHYLDSGFSPDKLARIWVQLLAIFGQPATQKWPATPEDAVAVIQDKLSTGEAHPNKTVPIVELVPGGEPSSATPFIEIPTEIAYDRPNFTPDRENDVTKTRNRSLPATEPLLPVGDRLDMDISPSLNPSGPEKHDQSIPARKQQPALDRQQEGPSWFVDNAGIVLLAPYLHHFFKATGLLEGDVFSSQAHAHRALHVLHYLATGLECPEEPVLLLPKILCGLSLEEAVPRDIELNAFEKEESRQLLEAAIRNWVVLKDTSPDGLRNTFLQRSGKLSHRGEQTAWVLQIERLGQDVLLDRLPWSFSVIKLPWMPQMLQVEW